MRYSIVNPIAQYKPQDMDLYTHTEPFRLFGKQPAGGSSATGRRTPAAIIAKLSDAYVQSMLPRPVNQPNQPNQPMERMPLREETEPTPQEDSYIDSPNSTDMSSDIDMDVTHGLVDTITPYEKKAAPVGMFDQQTQVDRIGMFDQQTQVDQVGMSQGTQTGVSTAEMSLQVVPMTTEVATQAYDDTADRLRNQLYQYESQLMLQNQTQQMYQNELVLANSRNNQLMQVAQNNFNELQSLRQQNQNLAQYSIQYQQNAENYIANLRGLLDGSMQQNAATQEQIEAVRRYGRQEVIDWINANQEALFNWYASQRGRNPQNAAEILDDQTNRLQLPEQQATVQALDNMVEIVRRNTANNAISVPAATRQLTYNQPRQITYRASDEPPRRERRAAAVRARQALSVQTDMLNRTYGATGELTRPMASPDEPNIPFGGTRKRRRRARD